MPPRFVSIFSLLLVAQAHAIDFSRDIQPLFAEHCLECHGQDKTKGGLALTTQKAATKTLTSGAIAVVPGDLEHSALIGRVLTTDLEDRMPPKGKKPLKPSDIDKLKAWIKDGAKFDLHWAYKPIPATPSSNTPATIDRAIQAKLSEQHLSPSPEADAATLIKRASYDLIGLPPTPEEVDAFITAYSASGPQPSPAWAALIDRLLASQHFGERWGRHWLDAARYADSDGYEKDKPRPDAWRYRDWVIHAINTDLPFDQFTIEQIAGDLLPGATDEQLVATAFHRQTLTNTEGGTDQEQFRNEAVMDRTETTGAVWLGLTVGCARCHSHKYDQISQAEYYQLFAFYNNGDEVTRKVPESQEKWAAYVKANGTAAAALAPLQKALDEALSALPVKLPAWEAKVQARLASVRSSKAVQTFAPLKIDRATATSRVVLKPQANGSYLASGPAPDTATYTLQLAPGTTPITAIQLEVLPDPTLPSQGPGRMKNGNFVLSQFSLSIGSDAAHATPLVLHSATADYTQKDFKPEQVLDGKGASGWAIGGGTGKKHALTLQLAEPLTTAATEGKKIFVTLTQNYAKKGQNGHTLGCFRLLASSGLTEASIAPPDVVKLLGEPPARRNPGLIKPLMDWLEKTDPSTIAAAQALSEAKAKLPPAPTLDVRVIAQRSTSPRETHVLHRGDFLQPTDAVEPAALAVLPPVKPRQQSAKPTRADRLDLAHWLVSADNPLPPRVTANAIWAKLFGEGLVRTAGDFGVRGDKPLHPELLDHLARRLIDLGWSRKRFIKEIMLSATYRQSSTSTPQSTSDPLNTLFWRQNRFRVDGEIVRDLHLAASGLLSPKIGGPSVFPPLPPDVANLSYNNNFKWATSPGEDRYRRGMYTFFKRTAPHPDLTTFDCPDANTTNVKRTLSNTPLQALTTLNAEAFTEAAQAMSRRLLSEPLKSDAERLMRCLRLCIARPAKPAEIVTLTALLADARAYYRAHADEAKAMTGKYTAKDQSPEESAAWVATARIVLNMDECITRE